MSKQDAHVDIRQLRAFFGRTSAAEARVYVRMPAPSATSMGNLRLQGYVHGPVSGRARTLPCRVPLVDRGLGTGLLAEAVLPDPAFWTTSAPLIYEVSVDVVDGSEPAERVVGRAQLVVGLRTLGARNDSLWWEGKRFVLRAVARRVTPTADLQEWSDLAAMTVMDDEADDELCEQASRLGVPLVVDFQALGGSERLSSRLHRAARWPAAIIAILPIDAQPISALRAAAPNTLLVASAHNDSAAECDALLCDALDVDDISRVVASGKPVLLRRASDASPTLAEARAACDDLQREFAGVGQFAGYLV